MKLILSMDPGAKNFAWTLLEDSICLLDHDYLIPVNEKDDFKAFAARFEQMLDDFEPDEVIFERYQFRGVQSTTAEPVNLMLGIIIRICEERGIPWYRVLASQWKNHYKKPLKKDEEPKPKDATKPNRVCFGLKEHEADAACIGHYLDTYWRERKPLADIEAAKRREREAKRKEKKKIAQRKKAAEKRKAKRLAKKQGK